MSIVSYSSKVLGSISFDDTMFKIGKNDYLKYIGPDKGKPIQPIGLKDYSHMFSNRKDLTSIDLSDWDMSEATDLSFMFCNFKGSHISGISKWDVSNVKDMSGMFYGCTSLKDISSLKDWNVSNVEDMSYMFYNCTSEPEWYISLKNNLETIIDGDIIEYDNILLLNKGNI